MHKIKSAHLQYVNNPCAKFAYKGMKSVGVTDYINQTPSKHFGWKNVYLQHPPEMKKIFMVHKIDGAHHQCVNNHYTKFEYKGMKT